MLAVLLLTTIGVLRRAITALRGYSISPMGARSTTLRTSQATCVLFGLFNYLSIYPFNYFNCYGYFAARKSTAFDGTVDFEKWVLYHAKSLRVGGFFCVLFSGVIVVGYNNSLNAIDYISQYIAIEFICFMVCINLKN